MDSRLARGNLFDAAAPESGERFDVLARFGAAEIERILSSATPDGGWYEQAHDEWVVLIRGTARLEVEGEILELASGDHLSLPAHMRHRVLATSPDAVWLAVHVGR